MFSKPMTSDRYEEYKEFFEDAKKYLDQKNPKLIFEEAESNTTRFIEIDSNNYGAALNTLTGQGLILMLKKTCERKGPWRCSRCQFINQDESAEKCQICKFQRSN